MILFGLSAFCAEKSWNSWADVNKENGVSEHGANVRHKLTPSVTRALCVPGAMLSQGLHKYRPHSENKKKNCLYCLKSKIFGSKKEIYQRTRVIFWFFGSECSKELDRRYQVRDEYNVLPFLPLQDKPVPCSLTCLLHYLSKSIRTPIKAELQTSSGLYWLKVSASKELYRLS